MEKKQLKALDVSVVTRAIHRIRKEYSGRTCVALSIASGDDARYTAAYENFVRLKNHGLPDWWDMYNSPDNKRSRIAALEGFKKAIKEAQAKSKLPTKAKALLRAANQHLAEAQSLLKQITDEYDV